MRISDWSSDVCSSDLQVDRIGLLAVAQHQDGTAAEGHLQRFSGEPAVDREFQPVGALGIADRGVDRTVKPQLASLVADTHLAVADAQTRSDGRRGGKECISTCRSRRIPYKKKK